MAEIVVRAPGRDKPGYLRRMRRALELQERAQSDMTVATLDQMIEFVLTEAEVDAPDGVDVRAALLDLSRDEWNNLFVATTGGGGDDAVNPPSGA
jgi:hypothetical protein